MEGGFLWKEDEGEEGKRKEKVGMGSKEVLGNGEGKKMSGKIRRGKGKDKGVGCWKI